MSALEVPADPPQPKVMMDEPEHDWVYKRIGHVSEAGGGYVSVFVDRTLEHYPPPGAVIFIAEERS